jgi:acetone carboxylase gamma subunit
LNSFTPGIHRVLGENILGCSTIGKYVRAFICNSRHEKYSTIRQPEEIVTFNDRIALVLSEQTFLSLRQIAQQAVVSKSIVHRRLTGSMGWKLKLFKWVLRRLAEHEKATRIQQTNQFASDNSQSSITHRNTLSRWTNLGSFGMLIRSSSGR